LEYTRAHSARDMRAMLRTMSNCSFAGPRPESDVHASLQYKSGMWHVTQSLTISQPEAHPCARSYAHEHQTRTDRSTHAHDHTHANTRRVQMHIAHTLGTDLNGLMP
jgi:hypothetical protein